jgi:multidrug efflux pump subunit AcrA (membrane-fusion protein)
MSVNPFTPSSNGTVNVPATAASASAELLFPGNTQVMVTCAPGGDLAFVEFGDSSVTASADTSTPVLPGAAYIFTISPSATHFAAVSAGSSTVYVTTGQGD